MKKLDEMRCEACRADAPTVAPGEERELMQQIPAWERVMHDGVPRLQRTFRFPDFAEALGFTNRVGRLAEEEDHHPEIVLEWGRVRVSWWTHKIRGLHRNDFIMAARTDTLYDA
jgi:4a-hydroxytetrahydrobiopterin dehydratase